MARLKKRRHALRRRGELLGHRLAPQRAPALVQEQPRRHASERLVVGAHRAAPESARDLLLDPRPDLERCLRRVDAADVRHEAVEAVVPVVVAGDRVDRAVEVSV
ncbi:MAG TPA: hypothetical protein VGW10_19385, partial [Solirubrobacteraceae bacterium]|nr:hypothetical protein [Solirubrobacteraceae bacterium]